MNSLLLDVFLFGQLSSNLSSLLPHMVLVEMVFAACLFFHFVPRQHFLPQSLMIWNVFVDQRTI
jgi:hypothetical protein